MNTKTFQNLHFTVKFENETRTTLNTENHVEKYLKVLKKHCTILFIGGTACNHMYREYRFECTRVRDRIDVYPRQSREALCQHWRSRAGEGVPIDENGFTS
ncbi:unnamed protein product, partial [Brenthis ino]